MTKKENETKEERRERKEGRKKERQRERKKVLPRREKMQPGSAAIIKKVDKNKCHAMRSTARVGT